MKIDFIYYNCCGCGYYYYYYNLVVVLNFKFWCMCLFYVSLYYLFFGFILSFLFLEFCVDFFNNIIIC